MTDAIDANEAFAISNFVNHAKVANADAPISIAAGKFSATRRSRVPRKRADCLNNSIVKRPRQPPKIFFGIAFKKNLKHALSGQRDIPLAADNAASFFAPSSTTPHLLRLLLVRL